MGPTERSASLTVPTCITVDELLSRVRAARVVERQFPRFGSEELWLMAKECWPPLCDWRVRNDGEAPLFSDALDGSTKGDELYGNDVLCASDATKCVNAMEHMRAQKSTHQALLHHGLTLDDAVLAVLRKINTAGRVSGKASLILAIARKLDTEEATPVLNALTAVLLSQAVDARGTPSPAFTQRHRCTLSKLALCFNVHLLQPRGAYLEVSHYSETPHPPLSPHPCVPIAHATAPITITRHRSRSNGKLSQTLCAQYSSLNRAATALSLIPIARPSRTARQVDARGYVLFHTNLLSIRRRPDGECAAEASEFATASKSLGDAVEALPPRAAGGVDMHNINLALSPSHCLCANHLWLGLG